MSNVVSLSGADASLAARTASIVEIIETALAQAEAGHMAAVAIAYVGSDGTSGTLWAISGQQSAALGAVTRLQWEMASGLVGDEE